MWLVPVKHGIGFVQKFKFYIGVPPVTKKSDLHKTMNNSEQLHNAKILKQMFHVTKNVMSQ